jgi:hypothetical protein
MNSEHMPRETSSTQHPVAEVAAVYSQEAVSPLHDTTPQLGDVLTHEEASMPGVVIESNIETEHIAANQIAEELHQHHHEHGTCPPGCTCDKHTANKVAADLISQAKAKIAARVESDESVRSQHVSAVGRPTVTVEPASLRVRIPPELEAIQYAVSEAERRQHFATQADQQTSVLVHEVTDHDTLADQSTPAKSLHEASNHEAPERHVEVLEHALKPAAGGVREVVVHDDSGTELSHDDSAIISTVVAPVSFTHIKDGEIENTTDITDITVEPLSVRRDEVVVAPRNGIVEKPVEPERERVEPVLRDVTVPTVQMVVQEEYKTLPTEHDHKTDALQAKYIDDTEAQSQDVIEPLAVLGDTSQVHIGITESHAEEHSELVANMPYDIHIPEVSLPEVQTSVPVLLPDMERIDGAMYEQLLVSIIEKSDTDLQNCSDALVKIIEYVDERRSMQIVETQPDRLKKNQTQLLHELAQEFNMDIEKLQVVLGVQYLDEPFTVETREIIYSLYQLTRQQNRHELRAQFGQHFTQGVRDSVRVLGEIAVRLVRSASFSPQPHGSLG